MTANRRMTMRTLGGALAALVLGLSTPALAQNADAPVDVTAAPPPSSETVGPSQLRDFNLKGTVTRPADRPATTNGAPPPATTTVAPPPAASRTTATDASRPDPAPRSSGTTAQQPSRTAAVTSDEPVPSSSISAPVAEDTASDSPAPATYQPAPMATGAVLPAEDGSLPWPWIAAVFALVLGGAFVAWSRKGRRERYGDPGRMAFAGLAPEVERDVPPAAAPRPRPRPDPVPAGVRPAQGSAASSPIPAAAAEPKKDDGLIVTTGLKPQLNIQFQPDRAVVTETDVLVQFDVLLANSGSAPARDVLVEAKLICAHAGQDQEIAAFFQNPVGQGDRIAAIPPRAQITLKSAVRVPISQLHCFEAGGRRLFVPLVAFNILFRSNAGEGRASASFLVGRGGEEDQKLAPFRIDLGPRVFRGLSARPHSMGLKQVA
jgi:hypothetical protein